jgi:hypothetical protein
MFDLSDKVMMISVTFSRLWQSSAVRARISIASSE